MKRDLRLELTTPYGKSFEPVLTLESACFQALSGMIEEDKHSSAEQKLKLYRLSHKVAKGGVVDFTTEELALVKERIGKVYGALVVGASYELLDQDYVPLVIERDPAPGRQYDGYDGDALRKAAEPA
jgi:hypothetical protein